MGRLLALLALGCAALVAAAHVSAAEPAACADGYTHSGVAGAPGGYVAARVTVVDADVPAGHAAGWIGVSRSDARAWLQVGVASFAGYGTRVYYELKPLGGKRRFVDLGAASRAHRFALAARGDRWTIAVDGRVRADVELRGSSAWPAVATGETWTPRTDACPTARFRFDELAGVRARPFTAVLGDRPE